jgi:hypothetical protein
MPLAQALIRHERCKGLLLCYSVPENWRKALIRFFREYCPEGRIVGIIGGDRNACRRASTQSFTAPKKPKRSWRRSLENDASKKLVRASVSTQDSCYFVRCTFPKVFEECEGPELESPHSGLFLEINNDREAIAPKSNGADPNFRVCEK